MNTIKVFFADVSLCEFKTGVVRKDGSFKRFETWVWLGSLCRCVLKAPQRVMAYVCWHTFNVNSYCAADLNYIQQSGLGPSWLAYLDSADANQMMNTSKLKTPSYSPGNLLA